jgi:hypothetical protein
MRSSIRNFAVCGLLVVGLALTGSSAQAGTTVIDFEGLGDVTPITSIAVPNNVVTFSIIHPTGAVTPAYTAMVGGPVTAFVSNDMPAGMRTGTFLTDETNGPSLTGEYRMQFAKPVASLSLDLYDYRVDGGPAAGDQAILTVYANSDFTGALATDVFTIPVPNPVDGNIENLAIDWGNFSILSATVTFTGADVGTGIDNVTFATIPAPGAMILGALGTGLVGYFRRRRAL